MMTVDMSKSKLAVILGLAIVVLGISFYAYGEKTAVPPSQPGHADVNHEAQKDKEKEKELVVYVSGAVLSPGVYKLQPGSRVGDAVQSAGGMAADADSGKINLAEKAKDGMHIHVTAVAPVHPAAVESPPAGQARHAAVSQPDAGKEEKININTADKAELDKLPGVGPALAARIVEYRQANGSFTDVADLKKVSGIGEAKFKQIKDKVAL